MSLASYVRRILHKHQNLKCLIVYYVLYYVDYIILHTASSSTLEVQMITLVEAPRHLNYQKSTLTVLIF